MHRPAKYVCVCRMPMQDFQRRRTIHGFIVRPWLTTYSVGYTKCALKGGLMRSSKAPDGPAGKADSWRLTSQDSRCWSERLWSLTMRASKCDSSLVCRHMAAKSWDIWLLHYCVNMCRSLLIRVCCMTGTSRVSSSITWRPSRISKCCETSWTSMA